MSAFPGIEAGGVEPPALLRLLRAAASLKCTLALLALLLPAIVLAYNFEQWRSWPLAVPLAGLSLNLIASVATNPAFRRQSGLLVFHLSLCGLLALVAVGRLTYLRGTLELTEGATFEGQLNTVDAGPYHAGSLDRVRFINGGFRIDYDPGLFRGATRNTVRWLDEDGGWRESVVGDQYPLTTRGYRFYTSYNKGFAPTFEFTGSNGQTELGSVHLPSYPLHELRQAREWQLPGTDRTIWIMLDFDEVILDPETSSQFRMPADYRVIVREGEHRSILAPGQTATFPEGTLRLVGLRSWMGYNVFYDWTLPWLAAAGALAALSLGTHFWQKFMNKPWDS
ncbi:MAG: cytochrome c biogenesis protein ResB [Rhodocyclaceae bacterium]|nr:cytochrome c biogenesis protein ResB [Rhodocyclaceae bacterium]